MRISSLIRFWAGDKVFGTLAPVPEFQHEPFELVEHVAPVPKLRLEAVEHAACSRTSALEPPTRTSLTLS